MAKVYRRSAGTRLTNRMFGMLTRFGIGASYRFLLIVPGRKTGRLHVTPLDVMTIAEQRWLVAGYGPANWVHNARAAGEVTLSRGGRIRRYAVADPPPAEAVRVLREYLAQVRVTRPYFDASADSPESEIEAEIPRHPVLRLTPVA